MHNSSTHVPANALTHYQTAGKQRGTISMKWLRGRGPPSLLSALCRVCVCLHMSECVCVCGWVCVCVCGCVCVRYPRLLVPLLHIITLHTHLHWKEDFNELVFKW